MVNGISLCLFSIFYLIIFISSSRDEMFKRVLYYNRGSVPFWSSWSRFLLSGNHVYIAYAMIALTALVVVLLFTRRHHYDEYHVSILIQCLAVATVLTLIAIAVLYVRVLNNPVGIVEKFTLFIVIHWVPVVFADLVYVFICRWR